MSTNNTTPAAESEDAVLSGGVLFIIIFCATSVFFLTIMTIVCLSEFKEYRTRRRRPSGPVVNGNYPRQPPPPLTVPPVTNPTIVGANYPRQPPIEEITGEKCADTDSIAEVAGSEVTKSVIKTEEKASHSNSEIVVLHDTQGKKHTSLQPLDLHKTVSDRDFPTETIFSPRTKVEGSTTVAFVNAPLPSISSNVSQSHVTPVVSISS